MNYSRRLEAKSGLELITERTKHLDANNGSSSLGKVSSSYSESKSNDQKNVSSLRSDSSSVFEESTLLGIRSNDISSSKSNMNEHIPNSISSLESIICNFQPKKINIFKSKSGIEPDNIHSLKSDEISVVESTNTNGHETKLSADLDVGVHLTLCDVTDEQITWSVLAVTRLHPKLPYSSIILDGCRLTREGVSEFLREVAESKVAITGCLRIVSDDLGSNSEAVKLCQTFQRFQANIISCEGRAPVVRMVSPATHSWGALTLIELPPNLVVAIDRSARTPHRPRPLPAAARLTLRLCSVRDEQGCQWAVDMAAALHPSTSYHELQLDDCHLNKARVYVLLRKLAEQGIRITNRIVLSGGIWQLSEELLAKCIKLLGCTLQNKRLA